MRATSLPVSGPFISRQPLLSKLFSDEIINTFLLIFSLISFTLQIHSLSNNQEYLPCQMPL